MIHLQFEPVALDPFAGNTNASRQTSTVVTPSVVACNQGSNQPIGQTAPAFFIPTGHGSNDFPAREGIALTSVIPATHRSPVDPARIGLGGIAIGGTSLHVDDGGMDLTELKARYGDAILFNGAIDSHHVLIKGTPESVRRQTRGVLRIMAPGEGYIAGASHDYILEETPVENVVAMFDTVAEFGVYSRER